MKLRKCSGLGPSLATILLSLIPLHLASCTVPDGGLSDTDNPPQMAISPLEEFIGAYNNLSPEDQSDRMRRVSLRQQEIIAQCMSDAGFEFIPWLPAPVISREYHLQPDNREWVAQWGYGIVDSPVGGIYAVRSDPSERDPNLDVRENLASPQERFAYWDALMGPPCPDHICTNWNQMGCTGVANIEIPHTLVASAEFWPLFEKIYAMREDINNSQAVIEVNLEWANCMANAGIGGLVNQSDAQRLIQTRLNELWPAVALELPAVSALREQEIDVALADLDCRESVRFSNRIREASLQAELQFVADHRPALEAFRAAAEQREIALFE